MAHAVVPTASKLLHYIPDLPPECKFCYNLSDSGAADNGTVGNPQNTPRETIMHYFWLCPRVQDFWQRVSCFLQGIREDTSGPVFKVDLCAVVTGFGAWARKIPNADVLHGLAAREIFRARAELPLDDKRLDGLAMFLRWKSTVIARILYDFYYSYSMIKAPHKFEKRWLAVSNRWYHFDPGDNELDGKISFRNESQQVAGRLHHIIHVLGRGGRFRPCIAKAGHTISNGSSVRAENGGGAAYQFAQCFRPTASVRDRQIRSIVSYSREVRHKRTEGTDPRRSPSPGHSSLEWGRAIPYDVASRLATELDMRNKPTGDEHQKLLGRGMPSLFMLKLNIKSLSDVRRRRQRHGLRAQVLAMLSELRLLIQACEVSGDRSARVFHHLEELNKLYLDLLCVHALPLRLRSALSCTLDMR
ncbi:hypothetical protein H4R27_006186 [Coemansia aciculifera]|nr:hypothetical protein H4R27_006186 [Coemansia aciculifera]